MDKFSNLSQEIAALGMKLGAEGLISLPPRGNEKEPLPGLVSAAMAEKIVGQNLGWMLERDRWERELYDGVKGQPPEWVPLPVRDKFTVEQLHVFADVVLRRAYDYSAALMEVERYATDDDYPLLNELVRAQGGNISVQAQKTQYLGYVLRCVRLGKNDGLRLLAGDDAVRGRKTLDSSKAGHEAKHGTKAQKRARYQAYQAEMDRLKESNPRLSRDARAQATERKFRATTIRACKKTILRHTT